MKLKKNVHRSTNKLTAQNIYSEVPDAEGSQEFGCDALNSSRLKRLLCSGSFEVVLFEFREVL